MQSSAFTLTSALECDNKHRTMTFACNLRKPTAGAIGLTGGLNPT